MSAVIAERPVPVKGRLISLLSALEFGLYPPDGCRACSDALADRCEDHAQELADMETVSAAVALVQDADGDDEARRVFMSVIAGLAGATRYGIASETLTGGAR
jgi:hypothetical protein